MKMCFFVYCRLLQLGICCAAALCLVMPITGHAIEVRVGVMSPKVGPSRDAGESHDYLVSVALASHGKIVVNDQVVSITPVFIDTQSQESDAVCRDQARRLLEEKNVALIIGPVQSGCVKSVLSGNLPVPVITSLASATSLTANRNPWFFRANGNDKARLRKLWKHIDGVLTERSASQWMIIHDTTRYGDGLREDLQSILPSHKVYTLDQLNQPLARQEILQWFGRNDRNHNVFLLGITDTVINGYNLISELARQAGNQPNIFTVGSSQRLLSSNPLGIVTVGEMTLRNNGSRILEDELARMSMASAAHGFTLYPTTYQAARFIVPQAIERALQQLLAASPDFTLNAETGQRLREAIREQLENGTFSSLQPPQFVNFTNGEMSSIFDFPINKINATYVRLDRPTSDISWVEFLTEQKHVNYLESPILVTIVGHNLRGSPVTLSLVKEGKVLTRTEPLTLPDKDPQQVSFHVTTPGDYEIHSSQLAYPAHASVSVTMSPFYLVCAASALIGVLMKQKIIQMSWGNRLRVVLEGMLAGFAVAFLSTYIQYWILPVAKSDWNILNGILFGFMGGWFGPMIIKTLTSRLMPGD